MENLKNLINSFSDQEREIFQKILGTEKTEIDELTKILGKLMLPLGGLLQTPMTYRNFIFKIARRNNLIINSSNNEVSLEKEVFQKLFASKFSNLSSLEQEELIETLKIQGLSTGQISALTGLGAFTAAQVSGFGIYILATSTLGAISSALGISFSFAVYTTLSSAISVVLGPVGFLILGYGFYRTFKNVKSKEEALQIFKTTGVELGRFIKGNTERAEYAFKFLAALRIVKITEQEEIIRKSKEKIDLNNKKKQSINEEKNRVSEEIIPKQNELKLLELELQRLKSETNDLSLMESSCDKNLLEIAATLEKENSELKIYSENLRMLNLE